MKVRIYFDPLTHNVNIGFIETRNGKDYIAKPVDLEFEEMHPDLDVKPTLRIPSFQAMEFMKALAEALDKQEIKTDKDAKIEGTLDATRYHLEDLRKLLKLK